MKIKEFFELKKEEISNYILKRCKRESYLLFAAKLLMGYTDVIFPKNFKDKDYEKLFLLNILICSERKVKLFVRVVGVNGKQVDTITFEVIEKNFGELSGTQLLQVREKAKELEQKKEWKEFNFYNFFDKELIDLLKTRQNLELSCFDENWVRTPFTFLKSEEKDALLQAAILQHFLDNGFKKELSLSEIKETVHDYIKKKRKLRKSQELQILLL